MTAEDIHPLVSRAVTDLVIDADTKPITAKAVAQLMLTAHEAGCDPGTVVSELAAYGYLPDRAGGNWQRTNVVPRPPEGG